MKNPYENLIHHIHVPAGLNDRVLENAQQQTVPRKKRPWLPAAVCAACALVLMLGSIRLPSETTAPAASTEAALPHLEFGITACALDGKAPTPDTPLSFTAQHIGGADSCCLFQVEGAQMSTVQLTIQEGTLYLFNEEQQTLEHLGDDTGEIGFDPEARYGFRLADQVGFLTIAVQFSDGQRSSRTYRLYDEALCGETGEKPLSPGPYYSDARPLSVRASDTADSPQLLFPLTQETTRISSGFGWRDTTTRFHPGVDLPAEKGTPIQAAADGVVAEIGLSRRGGNYVLIDHGNGLATYYQNCQEISVELNQQVHAGQEIALVGNAGMSTGPHLHFEVRVDGQPQDPLLHFSQDTVATLERPV